MNEKTRTGVHRVRYQGVYDRISPVWWDMSVRKLLTCEKVRSSYRFTPVRLRRRTTMRAVELIRSHRTSMPYATETIHFARVDVSGELDSHKGDVRTVQ